jgi:hypothetical protein
MLNKKLTLTQTIDQAYEIVRTTFTPHVKLRAQCAAAAESALIAQGEIRPPRTLWQPVADAVEEMLCACPDCGGRATFKRRGDRHPVCAMACG